MQSLMGDSDAHQSLRNTALNHMETIWEPWAEDWDGLIYLLASMLKIFHRSGHKEASKETTAKIYVDGGLF